MLLGESKQCHTGWHIDVIKMSVLQNFNFLTLTLIRLCRKKKKSSQMSHKYHISQGMETNHKLFSNHCRSLFSLKLLRNWKFLSPWSKARDKFVTSVVGKKTAWAGSQTTQYQTFLWKVCATKLWRNTLKCLSYTWIFWGDDLARGQNILQNFGCIYM